MMDGICRRNWLAHEYGTMLPVKWDEVADSVLNDIPTMESTILAALKANGHPV